MIELVFVIVVIGILASIGIGRMDRDLNQEAASTILSHIRLAQQLALNDNKHRSDNHLSWQSTYWRFQFSNCAFDGDVMPIYSIGSGQVTNGALNKTHSAIDPISGKYLYATCTKNNIGNDVSKDIFVGKHFGIKEFNIKKCITPQYTGQNFGFDYLGRLHVGINSQEVNFDRLATRDCELLITMSDDSIVTIIIEDETGHAYIEGQDNS